MTSHELARKLLEGSDAPIKLKVQGNIGESGDWDAFWGDLHTVDSKDRTVSLIADANQDSLREA